MCVYVCFNKHDFRGYLRQREIYGLFKIIFLIPYSYSCNKTGKGGVQRGLRVVAENTNWLPNLSS